MVLSLTNIAAMNIPINSELDNTSMYVLENVTIDCSIQMHKLEILELELRREYLETNIQYYRMLLSSDMNARVYACVKEMSQKHNNIINLRNTMAQMKLWSKNYVLLDIAISTYIAWPSATAERQELLALFYGIKEHHENIELDNPTESEQTLLLLINQYVDRCLYWYTTFNSDVNIEYMIELAERMHEIYQKIKKLEHKIKDYVRILLRLKYICTLNHGLDSSTSAHDGS